MRDQTPGVLRLFWLGNVLAVAVWLACLLDEVFAGGVGGTFYALLVSLCYATMFVLPGAVLTRLVGFLSVWTARVLAVLLAALVFFVLYVDGRLYAMYGFHFNGFVWNLLTTPGGFASLDSSGSAEFGMVVRFGLVILAQIVWLLACVWLSRRFVPSSRWMWRGLCSWVLLLLICQLTFGFSQILDWHPAVVAAQRVPFFIDTKVRTVAKLVGIKIVRNEAYVKQGRLNYPLAPIVTDQKTWSPNFIWLVSESLRADMLTPEIMPNLWKFAQDAHRFTDHYSGGNGTRQGVFSMFYSLPGNYWFAFLDAQREPAFIQLLQQRNYQMGLYTSSKFTYPEFNRTVFAKVPASELHQHDTEPTTWQNDIYNTKYLLDFIDQARQKPQPFFAFMFFNSPHARYQFPDYSVIRPDYLKTFNYADEDVADLQRNIVQIKNRYINSVHFLDMQLGRIFDYVAAHNLKQDTVIIITGDHAEEFMDEGRWGHNSELHNAQIHTPMVLWIPGKGSGVHDYPTSHLDFIPTLMPLMGVTTPVADYSEGDNLLNPTPDRYRLSANWNQVAYIGSKYKVILPVRDSGLTGPQFMLANDQPIPDLAAVKDQLQLKMMQVLSDVSRFYKKGN